MGGRRAPIFAGIGVAAAVLIVLFFLVLPKMGQVKDANATLTELQAQQATLGAQLAAAPPEPEGPPDGLTEREVEIVRLIALGHTNSEIGEQLYLSVRTIESHRAHTAEDEPVDAR